MRHETCRIEGFLPPRSAEARGGWQLVRLNRHAALGSACKLRPLPFDRTIPMLAPDAFPQGPGRRLLRLPEVSFLVGLRRSAIYDKISKGEFPTPVNLGPRAVAWPSNEI